MIRSLLDCLLWVGLVVVVGAALPTAGYAQSDTGRIEGIVADSTGAALPGVTVMATHLDTGTAVTAVTDGAGRYAVTSLRAGRYAIQATLEGFVRQEVPSIILTIGQVLRIDFSLAPGGIAETVHVVADTPIIDRVTSSLGTVINEQQVKELPLNGRNFTQLATLTPGVHRGIPGSNADGSRGNVETFRYGDSGGAALSVNGLREQFNNFLLDGVDNNEALVNSAAIFPPVEGIEEFRVVTSGAPAEFGRAAGAVINIITKGGTNEFHGSAYEFHRNEALDARPAFAREKLDFLRNQFGGSLGGPIVRRRTFFFGEYAGLRERLPVEPGGRVTVPTEKMRRGDFSELLNPGFTGLGQPIIIYNPVTGQPYQGNIIPPSQLDPVALRYLNVFPLPSITTEYQRNYFTSRRRDSRFHNGTVRLDHALTRRDNLFGRFSAGNEFRFDPGRIPGYQAGFGSGTADNDVYGTAIGHRRVTSANWISEARVGVNYQEYAFLPVGFGTDQNKALGIPGPGGVTLANGISLIGAGDGRWLEYLGDSGQYIVRQRMLQFSGATTYFRGAHTVKFGATVIRRRLGAERTSQGKGFYTFSDFTAIPGRIPPLGQTGFELSDILVGRTVSTQTGVPGYPRKETFSWENSAYAQDDWHVHNRLTLNLGLRYDVFTPYYEREDRLANFDPSTSRLILAGRDTASRSTMKTDWNNFGPRAGLAYQVSSRTVLRGAYGLFFSLDRGGIGNQLTENPPFVLTQFRTSGPGASVRLSEPIPLPDPVDPKSPELPRGTAVIFVPSDARTTQVHHYHVSLQRALGRSRSAMVAYVGTHGQNLTARVTRGGTSGDISQRLTTLRNVASSTFNGLEIQFRQNAWRGFSALASYTLSRAIDDSPGPFPGPNSANIDTPTDPRNLGLDEGLSDRDRRHYFSFAGSYELPWARNKPGAVGTLVGGWQANVIATFASGIPFSVFAGGRRAKLVGDWEGPRTVKQWFNTAAFTAAATPEESHKRNILRAPGVSTIDASLFKRLPLGGRRRLELRVETFNLFNKPQYDIPVIFFGRANFGEITATRLNTQRQIQLAVRLTF